MIGNNYRPSLLSNFFPIFLQHLAVFMISRSKLMIKKNGFYFYLLGDKDQQNKWKYPTYLNLNE